MKRPDRRHWAEPADITGLGQKTALWLEGEIGETPGYAGPPDEETREIVPTLARLNRFGGIVTYSSQPGYDGIGHDGAHWLQRPAVELLADPEIAAALAADAAMGFFVREHTPPLPRIRDHYDRAIAVSGRKNDAGEWETTCRFGTKLSRRTLREEFSGCSDGALQAVCRAHQITVVETAAAERLRPEGEEDGDHLWRWLDGWMDGKAAPRRLTTRAER